MKKIHIQILELFTLILILSACTTHNSITPLGEGNYKMNVSYGGPIINVFDMDMPIPFLSPGFDYGLTDDVNLNGELHILPLAYKVASITVGGSWFPVLNDGYIPTIGLHPRLMILSSLKGDVEDRFRIYPLLNFTSAWGIGKDNIYTGIDICIPLTEPDYDKESPGVIFSPFIGYRYGFENGMGIIGEFKIQGVNVESHKLAVDYQPIGDYGAISLLFGFEW